jgi:hypothetical protein
MYLYRQVRLGTQNRSIARGRPECKSSSMINRATLVGGRKPDQRKQNVCLRADQFLPSIIPGLQLIDTAPKLKLNGVAPDYKCIGRVSISSLIASSIVELGLFRLARSTLAKALVKVSGTVSSPAAFSLANPTWLLHDCHLDSGNLRVK